MKKLSALILSLALSAALLAGCGASASTAASSEAVSSEVVSEAVSEEAVSTAEAADSAEAIQITFTVTGADGESTVHEVILWHIGGHSTHRVRRHRQTVCQDLKMAQ